MDNQKILIVDDDLDIQFLLERSLKSEGYTVLVAGDGEKGFELAQSENPDLVILDIMLPETSGLEVCQQLREDNSDVFILMLTELSEDIDKVRGLDMGADDYLTKPFNILELSARVKAILRRNSRARVGESVRFGGVIIHFLKREVVRDGETVEFTPKEFELLSFLVHRPGEAVSREVLIEEIWGQSAEVSTRTIDNFVLRIRKKLEIDSTDPKYFQTVYGFGYKYTPDEK
ncbi:MAG: response regulator transcription factor [Nitrospinaceae bacterium]|nr:response regulator transcription factor [Nitrospinaceae bacterium]MBT3434728.1 response regulator transcription factor [Nitrospinaceae bacterium]MBT3821080.1 response regulator transcription factor [Nitrospinaceae bacterium]MBT4095813.1 response regulator transcription factor [Nitrospinaceae bacterium]MBT4432427.1 response regulator transcription factor [Nitrospinaceae bacterium]